MRRAISVLILIAAAAPAAVNPVLTELGQAINAYSARDYATAVQRLRNKSIPSLADYVVYYLAASQQLTGDFDGALAALNVYRESPVPASPLAGRISVLHARVLLDKKDPSKVLARSREPLVRPEPTEREGYVPNVVYTCGAMRHGDQIILPYAISDTFSNFATIKIAALMEAVAS